MLTSLPGAVWALEAAVCVGDDLLFGSNNPSRGLNTGGARYPGPCLAWGITDATGRFLIQHSPSRQPCQPGLPSHPVGREAQPRAVPSSSSISAAETKPNFIWSSRHPQAHDFSTEVFRKSAGAIWEQHNDRSRTGQGPKTPSRCRRVPVSPTSCTTSECLEIHVDKKRFPII